MIAVTLRTVVRAAPRARGDLAGERLCPAPHTPVHAPGGRSGRRCGHGRPVIAASTVPGIGQRLPLCAARHRPGDACWRECLESLDRHQSPDQARPACRTASSRPGNRPRRASADHRLTVYTDFTASGLVKTVKFRVMASTASLAQLDRLAGSSYLESGLGATRCARNPGDLDLRHPAGDGLPSFRMRSDVRWRALLLRHGHRRACTVGADAIAVSGRSGGRPAAEQLTLP